MGALISIEGGEFVGKTSVAIPGLADCLKAAGISVKISREPGGTPEGEQIRQQLFQRITENAPVTEITELFMRARKIHRLEVIEPFLGAQMEHDRVLILDRYLDSTRVYQGLDGGLDLETIHQMERDAVGTLFPQLTAILTLPEDRFETVLRARMSRADLDNQRDQTDWDQQSIQKHWRRQQYYLQLPALAKKWHEDRDFTIIDGAAHPFEVIKTLCEAVSATIQARTLLSERHPLYGHDLRSVLLRQHDTLQTTDRWRLMAARWQAQESQIHTDVLE